MTKRLWSLCLLAGLMAMLVAVTVEATNHPELIQQYNFHTQKYIADESNTHAQSGSLKGTSPVSLGAMQPGASPGAIVRANNYMDFMSNGSLPRQVDWAPASPLIHFSYTFLPTTDYTVGRVYGYNVWDPTLGGSWPLGAGVGSLLQGPGERGGFVAIAVDPTSGAGIVGGHANAVSTDPLRTKLYYDGFAGTGFWGAGTIVPDSVSHKGLDQTATIQVIWPAIDYMVNGSDTVSFAFSCTDAGGNVLMLFRKVGTHEGGTWTGRIVDTSNFITQAISTSRTSKRVAVAWIRQTAEGIAKGNTDDNDVWYQVSNDCGATWGAKHNTTNYAPGVAGFRAWIELNMLMDKNDKVRIVWPAWPFAADAYASGTAAAGFPCRIFEWVEGATEGVGTISTVSNIEWAPGNCTGGRNALNVMKVSISECANRYYVFWTQFNDRPAGILDDCANIAGGADPTWAANGDIYVAVSDDVTGTLWDKARDVTNSRTPGCDSVTGAHGPCSSDMYASSSPRGMDESQFSGLSFPSQARVDISGSYTGTWYTHILSEEDLFPGDGATDGGDNTVKTPNPMRWIRFACVPAIPTPIISLTPASVAFPTYTKHGQPKVLPITVENSGNVTLNVSAIGTKLTAPTSPNWLSISTAGPLSIPAGVGNTASMSMTLNPGGVINSPGTVVHLVGYVWYKSNSPAPLDSVILPIDALVADTVVGVFADTIATSCTRLVLQSSGNMGKQGQGTVNMDYTKFGECDTLMKFGNTKVYLYDGSPVVLKHLTSPVDTVLASWSIYSDGFVRPNGFKPVQDKVAPIFQHGKDNSHTDYVLYNSDQIVTGDSSIAVEKTWYAPKNAGDSCNFIIQRMRVFPYKGTSVANLAIGDAIDWDVPTDTASDNTSGADMSRHLIWQRGFDKLPRTGACQSNAARYSAIALLGGYTAAQHKVDTCKNDTLMYGGYTALNSDFVYPTGGFVPRQMWDNMQVPNYTIAPTRSDLHSVLTYRNNYTVASNDSLTIYAVLLTVHNGTLTDVQGTYDKALAWYKGHLRPGCGSCCTAGTTGDVDASGSVDISDLSAMVDYLFNSLPFPGTCFQEQDVDKSASVDISDLQALIDFLFNSVALPSCP